MADEKIERLKREAIKVKVDGIQGKDSETEIVRSNVQIAANLRRDLEELEGQLKNTKSFDEIARLQKAIKCKLEDIADREATIDEGKQGEPSPAPTTETPPKPPV